MNTLKIRSTLKVLTDIQPSRHFGDPASTLNRLKEFFKLFLSDGLNSEFAYAFGLKDV